MLIYDLVDPEELVGFVRSLAFDAFTLDSFLPNDNIDDIEYRFRQGDLTDQDAATFRAWDTEAPIASRQGVRRVSGELPPISRKIRLGEEERHRLRQLETGNAGPLIDQVYDDAANMARAVQARIELARGQALSTGAVTINENGMAAEVTFGVPAGHFVTAGTVHSDPAADIITDFQTWLEVYNESTNGLTPGVFLTSRRVINNWLRNAGVRALAATIAGTPSLITESALQQVFAAHGFPPFATYETRVRVNGVTQRVIPDDLVLFLPPDGENLGRTLYGVTAEALELAEEGMIEATATPGIVAVLEKTTDPVARWTLASGISLPVIGNPDLLLVADVL